VRATFKNGRIAENFAGDQYARKNRNMFRTQQRNGCENMIAEGPGHDGPAIMPTEPVKACDPRKGVMELGDLTSES
jgi:hypothetical protein